MAHVCHCPDESHATFGACVRYKGIRIAYCGQGGGDATGQRRWDAELDAYRDARRQGVQPAGTKLPQIQAAMEVSDRTGVAFDAGNPAGVLGVGE